MRINTWKPKKKCKDWEDCKHLSKTNLAQLCDCYIKELKKTEKEKKKNVSKRKGKK